MFKHNVDTQSLSWKFYLSIQYFRLCFHNVFLSIEFICQLISGTIHTVYKFISSRNNNWSNRKKSLNAQKIFHYLSVTIHYLLPKHVCSLEDEILFHLRKISTKFMTIHFMVLYHSNSEYNIQYSEYREHWTFFSKKFPLIQIWW